LKLSEFDYNLPKNKIAQYPLQERDSSRLLILHKKSRKIEHRIFREITEYFHEGDVLVLNDTRVIPARLCGRKSSGGKVEILLLNELKQNIWRAIIKGLDEGEVIIDDETWGHVSRSNGTAAIMFTSDIKKRLNKIGIMPLPPYIRRPAMQLDTHYYQTVYAEKNGSIAAPTAGLHFTAGLLDKLRKKVEVKKLTLHVGYGTFKPVSCEEVEHHSMEEEYYEIPLDTANAVNHAKSEGRRVIAVGTTTTRALESSACEGNGQGAGFPLLRSNAMGRGNGDIIRAGKGKTSIFIYPGYKFKVIDALITNFHLPHSTPLMLASAFCGLQLLRNAYSEAIDRDYRFFSYGDAMLILP